ncbi:hypothetical protein OH76DRAFT_1424161 [Lentinus brumalis]|uniref:Uncharacterized protein n=1 Tax=Lentinus brumalis TaxID=2498619 RepID=A0A371CHB1_9APHY|nr:hypothetical protein OH76DRAFT_1424161 [Polyporus brumalis]
MDLTPSQEPEIELRVQHCPPFTLTQCRHSSSMNLRKYRIIGGHSWTVTHVAVIKLGEDRSSAAALEASHRSACILTTILDRMLICHVYKCGLAPNPMMAQVGLVLNENVITSADGRQMALTVHIMKGQTLVSLLPANEPGMVVILHFTERKEYLACLKAMSDAEIACLDKQDEMKLTLRHGLCTMIPRHSDPSGPEVVREMHRGAYLAFPFARWKLALMSFTVEMFRRQWSTPPSLRRRKLNRLRLRRASFIYFEQISQFRWSSPGTGPGPRQDRDRTDLGLILVRSYISPVLVLVPVLATSGDVQDRPGPLLYQSGTGSDCTSVLDRSGPGLDRGLSPVLVGAWSGPGPKKLDRSGLGPGPGPDQKGTPMEKQVHKCATRETDGRPACFVCFEVCKFRSTQLLSRKPTKWQSEFHSQDLADALSVSPRTSFWPSPNIADITELQRDLTPFIEPMLTELRIHESLPSLLCRLSDLGYLVICLLCRKEDGPKITQGLLNSELYLRQRARRALGPLDFTELDIANKAVVAAQTNRMKNGCVESVLAHVRATLTESLQMPLALRETNDTPGYRVHAQQLREASVIHPGQELLFRNLWRLHIPIVVRGVRMPRNTWSPESFARIHRSRTVTMLKSNGLQSEQDWPPSSAFADEFKEQYNTFMRDVPMSAYTCFDGSHNLIAHYGIPPFPYKSLKPDLATTDAGGEGSTHLHLLGSRPFLAGTINEELGVFLQPSMQLSLLFMNSNSSADTEPVGVGWVVARQRVKFEKSPPATEKSPTPQFGQASSRSVFVFPTTPPCRDLSLLAAPKPSAFKRSITAAVRLVSWLWIGLLPKDEQGVTPSDNSITQTVTSISMPAQDPGGSAANTDPSQSQPMSNVNAEQADLNPQKDEVPAERSEPDANGIYMERHRVKGKYVRVCLKECPLCWTVVGLGDGKLLHTFEKHHMSVKCKEQAHAQHLSGGVQQRLDTMFRRSTQSQPQGKFQVAREP